MIELYILKFLVIILSVGACNFCWTYYFIKVEERKPVSAALWNVLILVFNAFTITSYINDKTFIIAACIGVFIGTYFSIKYKIYKDAKNIK